MVIAVLLGVFRTLIHVPVSLIYAGHLPPERYNFFANTFLYLLLIDQNKLITFFYYRFAAGYGLFMFFQGNLMFILGIININVWFKMV